MTNVKERRFKRSFEMTFHEQMTQTYQHIQRIKAGEIKFFKSGFRDLDDVIYGSVWPGAHIIIGARPSHGKSAMMQNMAIQTARQGLKTIYISFEDNATMINMRMLANLASVHMELMKRGYYDDADNLKMLDTLNNEVKILSNYLQVWDDVFSLQEIEKLIAERQPDVVFYDYLQCMYLPVNEKRGMNRNEELGFISKQIRRLAKRYNFVSVIGSQLNRKVEERHDKTPTLADLRDSGEIEQDGDLIALLWLHKDLEKDVNILDVHLAKNKNGITGQTRVGFIPRYCRIVDLDEVEAFEEAENEPANQDITELYRVQPEEFESLGVFN